MAEAGARPAARLGPAVERDHGGGVLCDGEGVEPVEPPPAPCAATPVHAEPESAATTVLRVLGPGAGGVHSVLCPRVHRVLRRRRGRRRRPCRGRLHLPPPSLVLSLSVSHPLLPLRFPCSPAPQVLDEIPLQG
ncbi:unnamed protein product [Miscanthus lutarioriparius]|uniref:Uncharacterized protein n=1 Tax=Miscanthus lutarioriparius TaxID=422564 RepID=A0A811Q7F5_9POAL|nr:unnamed protein product [Miscanthus lutarioriparius]